MRLGTEFVEKQRALFLQGGQDLLCAQRQVYLFCGGIKAAPQPHLGPGQQHNGRAAQCIACATARAQAGPDGLARTAGIVQPGHGVILHPAGQQLTFPGTGRRAETLELLQHLAHCRAALQAGARGQVLPIEQEAHEILERHGLDFPTQALDRVAVNTRQQVPFAPLAIAHAGDELPTQDITLAFEHGQSLFHRAWRQSHRAADIGQQQWATAPQPRAKHFNQGRVGCPVLIKADQRRDFWLERRVWVQCLHAGQPLAGKPQTLFVHCQRCRTALASQVAQPVLPGRPGINFTLLDDRQLHQGFVHFIGIGGRRPGLLAYILDRLWVQCPKIIGRLGVAPAPVEHGLSATLLKRCVIEKRVGAGV